MASFTKRGNKWRASVKVGEFRDTNTFETKSKAVDWARVREFELKSMLDGTSVTHTLGDVFNRYACNVSPSKKGGRWEIIRLEKLGRDPITKIKLMNLTVEDLQGWIDRRATEVLPSSANREMNLISHSLNMAKKWKWIKHTLTKDVERPKNPPPRERRITPEEIALICYCLNYEEGKPVTQVRHRVALAFLFAIETGMRAGEICKLTRKSIVGDVALLTETKNNTKREVPLSRRALELLTLLPSDNLFNLRSDSLSTHFRTARINAGIDDLTFHDSRHEAITRLADKVEVLDLARIVGHKDIKMLLTYYNKSARDIAAQLN